MPIYEYQCEACGHQFDALQKASEAPLTECPHCHKAALVKLVSAAGFQLKGSGWYATDYSGKGKAKQAASDAESGGSAGSGGSKSDAAAADKSSDKEKPKTGAASSGESGSAVKKSDAKTGGGTGSTASEK
ncbi:MAG TPA: zinc ribbon domain-containing protein [Gammaproteobacteria bacterium]|nr:zinc ribbon domain-containing protein [Gammaproteobacteria bacterium]